ncbi:hypothetical protein PHMEG_0002947 [Phytophthora megakarya]|uniref:Uncharacterized protein n=1 Tax=Phytophthora megakarya TaxID=4795 RepID=A0A225WZ91_9STRA|nr:hypothetical protein PHMEG_0002947 [Phytophthora megakarya]
MIPYVNNTNSQTTIGEVVVQQQRTRPIISRKITTDRKSTVKSMQRKRTQRTARIEKLKPPRLSLKDALSSPIGRISRAEALSPPPSPSSVASSETGESVESPTPERTVKTSKRFYQPKKQQKSNKQVESSLPMEEPISETKENSQLPPKTFLKRKPYKVVFHKLNWTNVASKTDSNLPTSVASRSSKPSRSSSQVSNSSISTSDDGYAGTSVELCINTKSGAFIDEATAQRLTALETAMYEQCGVTRQTASLVRFKYQTERKKFATTLQNQAQARRRNLESSSQANEHDICTSEATVTELWKRLTSDSSGQMYASMLRGFIERPAKL